MMTPNFDGLFYFLIICIFSAALISFGLGLFIGWYFL